MSKVEYQYYLLQNRWIARLEKGRYGLEPKEFFKNGEWQQDDQLNLRLNDAMMNDGEGSWLDYEDISDERAAEIMTASSTVVEQMVNGIVGPEKENPTRQEKETRERLSGRALEYLMFMDD